MSGIEILATEEVLVYSTFNWSSFWIALGIIFCFFIVAGVIISLIFNDWSNIVIGVAAGLIIGIIGGIFIGGVDRIPVEYETQYKVIISDEVLINEFMEQYEILDQEGKIYTIKERK